MEVSYGAVEPFCTDYDIVIFYLNICVYCYYFTDQLISLLVIFSILNLNYDGIILSRVPFPPKIEFTISDWPDFRFIQAFIKLIGIYC